MNVTVYKRVLFVLVALTALNAVALQLAIPNLDTITQTGTCPAQSDFEQRFYIAEGFIIEYNNNIQFLIDAGETQFEDSLLSTEAADFQALTLDDINALREPLLALKADPETSDLIKGYCTGALTGLGPVIYHVSQGAADENCIYTVTGSFDQSIWCANCDPAHDDYGFSFTVMNAELAYPAEAKNFSEDETDSHANYAAFSFGDGVTGFFDVKHEEVCRVFVPDSYRGLIEVNPAQSGGELTVSFVKTVNGAPYEALVPVYYQVCDSDLTKGPFFATAIGGITVDDVNNRGSRFFYADDADWIFKGATEGGYYFGSNGQTLSFRQFLLQCESGTLIESFDATAPGRYETSNPQVTLAYDLSRTANIEMTADRVTLDAEGFALLGSSESEFDAQLAEPVYAFAEVYYDSPSLFFEEEFYYEQSASASAKSVYWSLESSTFGGEAGVPPGVYEFTLFATDGQCFEEKSDFADLQETRTADARVDLYQYLLFKGETAYPVGAETTGATLQDVSSDSYGLYSYPWNLDAYTNAKTWGTPFSVVTRDSTALLAVGNYPAFEGAFNGRVTAQLTLLGLTRDDYAVLTVKKGEAVGRPSIQPGASPAASVAPSTAPSASPEPALDAVTPESCLAVLVEGELTLSGRREWTVQSEAYFDEGLYQNMPVELFKGYRVLGAQSIVPAQSRPVYGGQVMLPERHLWLDDANGDEFYVQTGPSGEGSPRTLESTRVQCEKVLLEQGQLRGFDPVEYAFELQPSGRVNCAQCDGLRVEVFDYVGGELDPVDAVTEWVPATMGETGVQYAANGFVAGHAYRVKVYAPLSVLVNREDYAYGGDEARFERFNVLLAEFDSTANEYYSQAQVQEAGERLTLAQAIELFLEGLEGVKDANAALVTGLIQGFGQESEPPVLQFVLGDPSQGEFYTGVLAAPGNWYVRYGAASQLLGNEFGLPSLPCPTLQDCLDASLFVNDRQCFLDPSCLPVINYAQYGVKAGGSGLCESVRAQTASGGLKLVLHRETETGGDYYAKGASWLLGTGKRPDLLNAKGYAFGECFDDKAIVNDVVGGFLKRDGETVQQWGARLAALKAEWDAAEPERVCNECKNVCAECSDNCESTQGSYGDYAPAVDFVTAGHGAYDCEESCEIYGFC